MKRTAIENFVPGIFRRGLRPGNPGSGFLDVMEQLHAPSEAILADLDSTFDPLRTRPEFVPMLARWVNLDRIVAGNEDGDIGRSRSLYIDEGRFRELTAIAARLSRWRGTQRGLLLFLQTATGIDDFKIEEQVRGKSGSIRPFHMQVRAPEAAKSFQALITRIIEVEKPAYVTYELIFETAPVSAAQNDQDKGKAQ